MEIIRLLYKDLMKLKSLLVSFFIQLLVSLFCLILVSNQFHKGFSNIVLLNSVKENNIVGIRTQTKSNIIDKNVEETIRTGLVSILDDLNSYSWYSSYDGTYTKIHYYGTFMDDEIHSNGKDLLVFGRNVDQQSVDRAKREFNIEQDNVFERSSFFDSRNGRVDLQNAIVIVNSDSQSIHNLAYDHQQLLLHNLHLYDVSEDQMIDVVSLLNSDNMLVHPLYINESNHFIQLFINDLVLFIYFSTVFIFVLLNLYLILFDIVRTNTREYAINKLYGATDAQIILRIELLVLVIYLIPSVIVTSVFFKIIPNGLTPFYFYTALVLGQVLVSYPVIKTLVTKDIASQLRSDFK